MQFSDISIKKTLSNISDQDTLSSYFNQIGKYTLLSFEEEQEIAAAIEQNKKELLLLERSLKRKEIDHSDFTTLYDNIKNKLINKRNILINANLKLVVSIAKTYQHQGLPLMDLIAEGNIGLIDSLDRFNYELNVRLSTYSTWWIRHYIDKSIAENGQLIRLPHYMYRLLLRYKKSYSYLYQKYARKPTVQEISSFLGITDAKALEVMRRSHEVASLEVTIDGKTKLVDLLVCERSYENLDSINSDFLKKTLSHEIEKLEHREKEIIQLRYGLTDSEPMTLKSIGKKLGLSVERIRQLQNKALLQLKESEKILDFMYYI